MWLPLFIANRIQLSKGGTRDVSAGMVVAVAGVALSVFIMIASICIVTGFKKEITHKLRGINSDIVLYEPNGYICLTEQLSTLLDSLFPTARVNLVQRVNGILKTQNQYQGLTFTGMDSLENFDFLKECMTAGELPNSDSLNSATSVYPLWISETTAKLLELKLGDKVDGFFVGNDEVRARRFKIAGMFATHFGDYDRTTSFTFNEAMPINEFFSEEKLGNAVEISLLSDSELEDGAQRIYTAMLDAYSDGSMPSVPMVRDVWQTGELYFNWLALLDTNVIVILILMGIVSAFTLVASLFIIILRRVRMIGILKSLGATNNFISNIFLLLSFRIILLGVAAGNVLSLGILLAQQKWHFAKLSAENYYLDYVPVNLVPSYILALDAGIIIFSLIILIGPARVVSSIKPGLTMRYE